MQADPTHLTALFENATEGIILTNGVGNIIMINPAGQRIFGYEARELFGKPIETLVPARVQHEHTLLRESFYDQPQNRVMVHGRDLHGKRKDNTEIPLEVSLGFYKKDQEMYVIAFIVDITTRKNIERNLHAQQKELEHMAMAMQRLNAELEMKVGERTIILKEALEKLETSQHELQIALKKEKQLGELKSSFVSLASHEFRTPLATILSSAALVARYPETSDQDKRDKHVRRIKESVKHLNQILEDFLSLGKLEDGKIRALPESFDLEQFLCQVVDEFDGTEKSGQQLILRIQAAGAFCSDKKIIRNILINIIGNAIKFSPVNALIEVFATISSRKLVISVTDQGIGIPPSDMEHLFSSFFRGKNATNIEGTGLGLHIVKRYLDLLGGIIRVQSEQGRGTTFECLFPDLNTSVDKLNSYEN
ncbi:MAG: PAS domain-containing sensor histidine kinase [Chitinophagaceae bacterium]|nr:MAG: PAS domain-containing sensor histidine kinase [Chitinophagaceae bacterium]